MIVAVASGKGGTGKTTVSVNLARVFEEPVQLLDCDVEEPNVHLFLRGDRLRREAVHVPVPEVNPALCNACGECSDFCQFNAIAVAGTGAMVFPELCHGCGGCALVCPRNAIREVDSRIGVVETVRAGGIDLVQGRLDVGIASSPPLIEAVKAGIRKDALAILDAPPGTSCPAVATLRKTDYAVLVTEPTPFGLHDLRLAVSMTEHLGIPCGVVVNRHGIGDNRVHAYCRQEGIPILLEIPDDRRIAEAYSRGEMLVDVLPEYRSLFEGLRDKLLALRSSRDVLEVRVLNKR